MNPEDVSSILDDITSRLAPASEAAWNVMLVEVRISSAFAIGIGVLLLLSLIVGTIALFRMTKPDDGYSTSDDANFARLFGSSLIAMFGLPAVGLLLYNGVVGLVIPEWHIINKFLNILQGS